jgi:transcriptional regulator with XRE-family HTH domain
MKITAITKFKQGDVWNALQKAGWTQTELAKRTGIHVTRIGEYCNLKAKPNSEQANKIQKAFGSVGVFVDVSSIWPEDFIGVKKTITVQQTQEIDVHLLQEKPYELHETCKPNIELLKTKIDEALNTLDAREQFVMHERFYKQKTYDEICKKLPLTRSRIQQIELRALRRLRNSKKALVHLGDARTALIPTRMSFV